MKRGQSGLSLVIGVDKPEGMSSHDVVNRCRSIFGEKRVGHAGTLDPFATGVLPICIGPATRLADYLSAGKKTYACSICFGKATDTCDLTGKVIEEIKPSSKLGSILFARTSLSKMKGVRSQIPPNYSAVKINGVPCYKRARAGEEVSLTPRTVTVYDTQLLAVHPYDEQNQTITWDVIFEVSKGTYIRSLARDLGELLESCAHVSALRRLKVGNLEMASCYSLEELSRIRTQAALDPVSLLPYPVYELTESEQLLVQNGNQLMSSCFQSSVSTNSDSVSLVSMTAHNKLLALYRFEPGHPCLKPQCIFNKGISRGSRGKS